jgi:ABC-type multidrug transport system ATPase subunit
MSLFCGCGEIRLDADELWYEGPGAGLSIEQRKRLTIAVELVAKPDIIFLDEPTSGLDGSFAFNIVRFVRTLADCGQAVLVSNLPTIFCTVDGRTDNKF